MSISIAYGVILEQDNHRKVLNSILAELPAEEQKLLYMDIYDDEYAEYTDEQKREVEALDITTQEFKDEAFATLADRDAIYTRIAEQYPLLSVATLTYGERAAIFVNRSFRSVEQYAELAQAPVHEEEMEQLLAALTELELDLNPRWLCWQY